MVNLNERVVTLIDMDCFYCQVEVRLNPSHKGKPLAVVQYNQWKGGGIIAVNYEARDKGVKRGMRGEEAKQKCPDIVLVSVPSVRGKADISKYRDAGKEVVMVFKEFCGCVERASIDEAYLDLTEVVKQRTQGWLESQTLVKSDQLKSTFIVGFSPDDNNDEDARTRGLAEFLENQKFDAATLRLAVAAAVVEEMRTEVLNRTGFHCSAGIAHNKVLAKLVCGIHKPRRQTVLPLSCVEQLFSALPVHKVRNLGGKFGCEVVDLLGCETMGDLAKFSEKELQQRFDEKTGSWLYEIARGIDNDPVTPRLIPKSIGCSKNFPGKNALSTKEAVEHWMKELCHEVSDRLTQDLEENKRRARLLTVSVSLDGTSTSRSGQLPSYDPARIAAEALSLISRTNQAPPSSPAWTPVIKMIAISTGKFVDDESSRSTGIQHFFKQVPKENLETTVKDETAASTNSESTPKLQHNPSSLSDNIQTSSNKRKKDSVNLDSFFIKTPMSTGSVTSDSELGKSAKEDTSKMTRDGFKSDDGPSETSFLKDTAKSKNSFFLNYLQKIKSDSSHVIPSLESSPKKKIESPVKSSTSETLKGETDDSISQLKEMFPNPSEVEESVINLLPPSMQETFYKWRSHFRKENGLLSPEKPFQLKRKTGSAKPVQLFNSPRKTECRNQKLESIPPKPSGILNSFFQTNRQNSSKSSDDPKPGSSFLASEDSNSSDVFSVHDENSSEETERCSICSRLIPLREFPEHADYHAALSLDEMWNNSAKQTSIGQSAAQNTPVKNIVESRGAGVHIRSKRGRPPKSESCKNQRDKKLKSISSFFAVKESPASQVIEKRA